MMNKNVCNADEIDGRNEENVNFYRQVSVAIGRYSTTKKKWRKI